MRLNNEHYQSSDRAANDEGQTPDLLVPEPVEDLRDPRADPHHYETDVWFRHLGMTDENIRSIKASIRSEMEYPRDADVW
jgi:hypothetical protein